MQNIMTDIRRKASVAISNLAPFASGSTIKSVAVILCLGIAAIGLSVAGISSSAHAVPITTPTGLSVGEQYRLVFALSTRISSTGISDNIEFYNVKVNAAVDTDATVAALPTTWTAIVSTTSVDARVNTDTNPGVGPGVPIYLLDGSRRIANNNFDLWDGTLINPIEIDARGNLVDPVQRVWTGSRFDGTASAKPLGSNSPTFGLTDKTDSQWIDAGAFIGNGSTHSLYGISAVLTVVAADPVSEPATLTLFGLGLLGLGAARRRVRKAVIRQYAASNGAKTKNIIAQIQSLRLALIAAIGLTIAGAASTAHAAPITTPTALNPGEPYRLVFVTSTVRNAVPTDIAIYNDFVDDLANTVPELFALGTTWKAIVSSSSVDARDNTGTNPNFATGAPIYLLDGVSLIATSNADLWDITIANFLNLTEQGEAVTGPTEVWSASDSSGVELLTGPLGGPTTVFGSTTKGQNSAQGSSWISVALFPSTTGFHLYGMSAILTAPPGSAVPEPATLTLFGLGLAGLGFARRRKKIAV